MKPLIFSKENAFASKEKALNIDARGKASQASVVRNNTVTGKQNRKGVSAQGAPNRPAGSWPAQFLSQPAVAPDLSVGDFSGSTPDSKLK